MKNPRAKKNWQKLRNLLIKPKNKKSEEPEIKTVTIKYLNKNTNSFENISLKHIKKKNNIDLKKLIIHLKKEKTISDNTGLKLWDCELLLTNYIFKNLDQIENKKKIIEFAAGFSGLLIQFIIKYFSKKNNLDNKTFFITEGNDSCLKALKKNFLLNFTKEKKIDYQIEKMLFQNYNDFYNKNKIDFDLMLFSEVLFFKDFHNDLLNLIEFYLNKNPNCKVFMLNEERDSTVRDFIFKIVERKKISFKIENFFVKGKIVILILLQNF